MEWDDVIYLALLFFSIGFGEYFRRVESVSGRQWLASLTGAAFLVIVSGVHVLHPLLLILINCVIILGTCPRYCHILSFVASFCYLIWFRTTYYFGIPYAPAHTNAVQMMLTLKLVGLAFEVQDTFTRKEKLLAIGGKDDKELGLLAQFEQVNPTLTDIFHYSFCYMGILTGPYYKFRTYWDMLNCPYSAAAPCLQATLSRIKVVPLYAVLYLLSAHYFPLKYAETEEIFQEHSLWYRIWYMTPLFFNFRMRIYTGFVLAECACIMAGLGAYPARSGTRPGQGPSKYDVLKEINEDKTKLSQEKYDFKTVHNIDEYNSDFVPTVREGMRYWNMTVQYWLAVNVYRRLPSTSPRVFLTMLTSAVWHGVYAGYYLCLLTVPFVLVVEGLFDRLFRRPASEKGKSIYDWISWFFKMQAFSYMGMAFLLLRVDTTLHYWKSIWFIGHVLLAVSYAVGTTVLSGRSKPKVAKDE